MGWREHLAAMEALRKERDINRKLELARRASWQRKMGMYLYAHSRDEKVWLDYLHERRISADLNLTVCQPDNPPT